MPALLAAITLVVADYDEAIAYFVGKLGFELVEDTPLSAEKRWVRVRPAGNCETCLLLAKAKNEAERASLGKQTGGRVAFFLNTDDFSRDYQRYTEAGVDFIEAPRREVYGQVVVFRDLYGNLWDLIGPAVQP